MREKAWQEYFRSGDTEPLIKAYWDSIQYMAWDFNERNQDDLFQVGLLGLIKAAKTVDVKRVRSLDAWVFLNVRGAMRNLRRFKQDYSLDILYDITTDEDSLERRIDLKIALETRSIEKARGYLQGYEPMRGNPDDSIERYHRGKISLRALSDELGISKRQTYKLLGKLPDSW